MVGTNQPQRVSNVVRQIRRSTSAIYRVGLSTANNLSQLPGGALVSAHGASGKGTRRPGTRNVFLQSASLRDRRWYQSGWVVGIVRRVITARTPPDRRSMPYLIYKRDGVPVALAAHRLLYRGQGSQSPIIDYTKVTERLSKGITQGCSVLNSQKGALPRPAGEGERNSPGNHARCLPLS